MGERKEEIGGSPLYPPMLVNLAPFCKITESERVFFLFCPHIPFIFILLTNGSSLAISPNLDFLMPQMRFGRGSPKGHPSQNSCLLPGSNFFTLGPIVYPLLD